MYVSLSARECEKSYAASQATQKIGRVCWHRNKGGNDGADQSELVTRPLDDVSGFNFQLFGRSNGQMGKHEGSRPLEEGAPPKI